MPASSSPSRLPLGGLAPSSSPSSIPAVHFSRRRLLLGCMALLGVSFLGIQYLLLTQGVMKLPTKLLPHVSFGGKARPTHPPILTRPAPSQHGRLRESAAEKQARLDALAASTKMRQRDTPWSRPRAPVSIAPVTQTDRLRSVKRAMQFAWSNYEEHAFGGDEVDPVHGTTRSDVWGGIACSMVDALDTLWIMGMTDEFQRARDYISKSLNFDHLGTSGDFVSVFETVIREVGGLLSAYDLSQDEIFKVKAQELVDLLTPAFSETEGVFYTFLNPHTKERRFAPWASFRAHIADIGSLQLEMRYLSDITGDAKYAEMGDALYTILRREGSFENTGLFPVHFDATTGHFNQRSSKITIGALGDSFYEYLLKVYIYSGKREEDHFLRELYDDAVRGIEEHLVYFSEDDNLHFLQELSVPSLSQQHVMDHLLCFTPGLLALGTLHEHEDMEKNKRHLRLAKELMETCYQMYHQQPTGLSPDIIRFPGMKVQDRKYRLRPEAIESLFYLYRATKDEMYREQGWEIFESLEKYAKTEHGYGAIVDVTTVPPRVEAKMESFFLAETLKYHYLLQAPEDVIPLDQYVFNTEAHPVRIRNNA